jgi:transcriptional regulator NrdR family protein
MSLRLIKQIESNIKTKMKQIKNGEVTPKDSAIGIQFTKLKSLDEASYEKFLSEYKEILSKLKS